MLRGFLVFSLFIGILLVIVELVRNDQKCPKNQIVYRYIPRSFEEEQDEPAYVTDIFKTMFTQPSTWIGAINDLDTRKRENINQYFISQM